MTSSDVTRNLGTKAYDPRASYDKGETKIKYRLKYTVLDGTASNKAQKKEQYKASNNPIQKYDITISEDENKISSRNI